jgi:hypothetical protein
MILAPAATAERRPEERKEAKLVIVGKVEKVTTATETFAGDGEFTYHTAHVVVDKVERGEDKDAKPGATVKVYWYTISKAPSKQTLGVSGHGCSVKAKEKARFWTKWKTERGWEALFPDAGIEKLKE